MGIIDSLFSRKKVKVANPENKENPVRVHKIVRQKAKVETGQVYEGKVTNVMPYGIFVDIGVDSGLVHIKNLSWQYMDSSDIAAQYNEGQTVRVVVLGYDDKGRIQLGRKQLYEFKYTKGDKLGVTVKGYIPGEGLEAAINDELNTSCAIPLDELSWTGDVVPTTLVGKDITVVVIRVDQRSHRMTCSLRMVDGSPWEKPTDIHVDSVIEVKVLKYNDSGLSIATVNEGLPGFIHKNQITWLVPDDSITEADCPKPGSIVRAVVKMFDPQAKKLLCSIRDIQDNPWEKVAVGQTISGNVVIGRPGFYTVMLENGIKCVCNDDTKLSAGKKYDFLLTDVDGNGRKAKVSREALEDAMMYAHDIRRFFSKRGISKHVFMKDDVILMPQDITCNGEPMAMPFAIAYIFYLDSHPEKLVRYKEISAVRTSHGTKTFISVDVLDLKHNTAIADKEAIRNVEVPIEKTVTGTENGFIVQIAGRFGYIEKMDNGSWTLGREGNARFVSFGHGLQIDRVAVNDDMGIGQDTPHAGDNIFNLDDDEVNVLDDNEKGLLEAVVAENPGMSKDNVKRVMEQIVVTYDPANANLAAFRAFISKDPDYFKSNNFWLTSKTDDRKGIQTLHIYDDNDVMLKCIATDNAIILERFYCERQHYEAQKELNHSTNALFLPANHLQIFRQYAVPPSYEAKRIRLAISRQYDIFAYILPELRTRIRKAKRTIGKDYVAVSQFLKFQQNNERRRLDGIEIDVDSSHIRIGSIDGSREIGLFVNNPSCVKFFDDESDKQNVRVVRNGEEKGFFATLQRCDAPDEFFLHFKYTPDLDAYKDSGFVITPNANLYHLQIQQRSINDFVEKGDMLTRLEQGKINKPVVDGNIHFLDSKFNNVEEGNSQPMAIRKAVGNQDIFLIQGPPGTGKTSVIVEIIRQLVRKGERVLVCSQAHSAVKNIYDRIRVADDGMNIGFLDEDDTMRPLSFKDHQLFMQHNIELIDKLAKGDDDEAHRLCDQYETEYSDNVRKDFSSMHRYLVQYFHENVHDNSAAREIITKFKEEIEHLENMQNGFYAAGHISSLQVVMGTCIGIGTDPNISKSGVRFDTLIVDEAGKANLAETNVPMQLASKYILVGDDNQLPPYMDTDEIGKFKTSEEAKNLEDGTNVEEALGMSLFEYFLRHERFPQENQTLLNYQYRMNPVIGEKISSLFYGSKLHNGSGTESQNCDMQGFPEAVTFVDTGHTRDIRQYDPYEKNSGEGAIYNPCEAGIIIKDIVPKLESIRQTNSNISIGIIAPYNAQVRYIKKVLADNRSPLSRCVYTIDNVQGQEYDIVVISFVRSFPLGHGRKVGFLDDLRRLNVALSRAKKKLIMVGNLPTLTCPDAHNKLDISDERKQPAEIFKRISSDASIRHAELNNIDKLAKHGIRPGYVFKNCRIAYRGARSKQRCYFLADIGGETLRFPLSIHLGLTDGTTCDVKFIAINDSGNDHPSFDVARPVIIAHDSSRGRVKLADGSEKDVKFDINYKIFATLLCGDLRGVSMPLAFYGNMARVDGDELRKDVAIFPYEEGDIIKARIIAKTNKALYMDCHGALGIVYISRGCQNGFSVGSTIRCKVSQKDPTRPTVTLIIANQRRNTYGH